MLTLALVIHVFASPVISSQSWPIGSKKKKIAKKGRYENQNGRKRKRLYFWRNTIKEKY